MGSSAAFAIEKSSATGGVAAPLEAGGLVGFMTGTGGTVAIQDSYATGNVGDGTGFRVGGLVGCAPGGLLALNRSYAVGAVSGSSHTAGLVGNGSASSVDVTGVAADLGRPRRGVHSRGCARGMRSLISVCVLPTTRGGAKRGELGALGYAPSA